MSAPPQLGGPKTIELQKPPKSLEEREREYALARQKIFNDNKQAAAEREDKERRERDNTTWNHHNSGSARARPSGGRGVDDPYGGGRGGGGRGAGRSGSRGGRARGNY